MPRALVVLRWLAAVVPAVVAPVAAANPGAPLHAPQPVVNCGPPAPPCAPCTSAPVCATAPPPKVVVHVPPPEVVFERGCGGSVFQPRFGLFRKHCGGCGHCDREQAQTQVQTQTVLTPLSATMTSFGSLGQFGVANLSVGGAQMVAAPAVSTAQLVTAAPAVERVQLVRQVVEREESVRPTVEMTGLRAIHEAELRAAAIVAARAQQDAELRATLAALDRARGSVSATLTADCKETDSSLTMKTASATLKIHQHLEVIEQRLIALEADVKTLKGGQGTEPKAMPGKP